MVEGDGCKDGNCVVVFILPCNNTGSSKSSSFVTNSHLTCILSKGGSNQGCVCKFPSYWQNFNYGHKLLRVKGSALSYVVASSRLCDKFMKKICHWLDSKLSRKASFEFPGVLLAPAGEKLDNSLIFSSLKDYEANHILAKLLGQDKVIISACLTCCKLFSKDFKISYMHDLDTCNAFQTFVGLLKEDRFYSSTQSRTLRGLSKRFKFHQHDRLLIFHRGRSKSTRQKRDAQRGSKSMQSFNTPGHEETIDSSGSAEDSGTFNESYVTEFFKRKKMRQQLQMEADSALLCLVFISCLMLFGIWYLRGFHSRNTHNREVTFHDSGHLLSVKEVLYRKRHFLPMFIRDDGLEEVWVHDCGNDP